MLKCYCQALWAFLFWFLGGDIIEKPKSITNQEADLLKSKLFSRDAVLLQLAVESGLRISDILKLKVADLKKRMTVYEMKSRRKRTFEISDELLKKLKWLTHNSRDNDFIFYSERKYGVSVHRSTIHRRIKKALRGLDFDASAHSTRKLYAQNIFKETGSVSEVQKAMNHKKVLTTLTYLDVDVGKLMGDGVAAEAMPHATEGELQNAQKKFFGAIVQFFRKIFANKK